MMFGFGLSFSAFPFQKGPALKRLARTMRRLLIEALLLPEEIEGRGCG